MSADVLREAAVRIRHDVEFGQAHGDDTFLFAVADWLDFESEVCVNDAGANEPVRTAAIAVARAYLGSTP